ncbi:conjugative transposon protein TraM [Runella sp. MFBS21]|uniref:conjugative transposon protein TraM n=1 Tax=Runella sp. MFBS21 TaxID=3034018 RepID=UPI0023F71060|nr:conjugative transposon protein TraM [Runella sp. MFBS21]MDF7821866.1 conjugative transposon protein TraM [Runella sp. MFBS21]
METVDNSQKTVRKLSQKQYQLVALAIGAIFGLGLVLWSLGVFKSEETPATQENKTETLASVPAAKNQPLENDKYKHVDKNDPRFSKSDNSLAVGYVVGAPQNDQTSTNEGLSEQDFQAVETAGAQSYQPQSPTRKKQQIYQQSIARQRAIQREQARLADPNYALYQKSPEELREERQEAKDREINQRTAQLVLDNLEKNQNQVQAPQSAPTTVKKKNDEEEKDITPKKKESPLTEIQPEIQKNTIGMPVTKVGFFYNVSMKNKNSYSANDAVLAVVHGNGSGGIKIQNGTTAKIRLLQNIIFRVKGEPILLEKGTILNGRCSIGEERVYISITSMVIGNAIYPLTVQAFDMDGQLGIYVPNLREKNMLAQNLSRTATGPLNGGFFVGQGGIAQQVGTQVAVQAAQQTMQSARQYATTKAQNPKVTIRPNYQILLKSSDFTPTTSNAPTSHEEIN